MILTFVILVLQSTSTQACLCDEDWSAYQQQVRNAFYESDYIGLIEISSTSTVRVMSDEIVAIWNPETQEFENTAQVIEVPRLIAQFTPLRVWKGNQSVAALETPGAGRACSVSFEAGGRYLLYADGPDDEGKVQTDRCMRTTPLEESAQDIATLDFMIEPTSRNSRHSAAEENFSKAVELVHSYSGAGDELSSAMGIANSLSKSDAASGFAETLLAEALSTWELGQDGKPDELRMQILQLANEALRLNPDLAQAHVAKARAYLRASQLMEAETEISKALTIDSNLESAIFQQAEIYRRSGNMTRADNWYRGFIEVTPAPARKSNAYSALAKMYQDVASGMEGPLRKTYLYMARQAYQSSVDLDPRGAWKLVNFAIFLNGQVADHDAAEVYAQKALEVMEFPMARYHLAAARYLRLQSKASAMHAASLQAEIALIAASSKVSLEQAISFTSFSSKTVSRLTDLKSRSTE